MISAKFLSLFLIVSLVQQNVFAFVALKRPPALISNGGLKSRTINRHTTAHHYKNEGDHHESAQTQSFPQTEPGCRYHLNLARSDPSNKPHEVATLTRNFPDMSVPTIEEIVTIANDKGRALIRALSCKDKAYEMVLKLHAANPPLPVEVFDTKREELVDMEM